LMVMVDFPEPGAAMELGVFGRPFGENSG
jgi:hypothetical protein